MPDYDLKVALKRINEKPFNFVLIKGTKSDQVVISPKPIGPKQLNPVVEECGDGKRIAKGICMWEQNAEGNQFTFATKVPPSPTWEKMITVVFRESKCTTYLPIVMRQLAEDESEEVSSEEGEIDSAVAEVEKAGTTPAPAAVPKPPPVVEAVVPPAPPVAPPSAAPDPLVLFTERLKALMPKIKDAIAASSPAAQAIKVKVGEAGEVAKKKDFVSANRALDEVEGLLKNGAAASAPVAKPAPKPAATDVDEEPKEKPLSTYLMGRANLRKAREAAEQGLKDLQAAILAKAADEPFFSDVEAKSQKLFDYLVPIDDSVATKLDAAGISPDPELQAGLNKQVRALIQKQLTALRGHALAPFLEKNPFGSFMIRQPLESTLTTLDQQLS